VNRRFGKITCCMAVALATGAALRADDLALNSTPNPLADNPYSQIVTRNVFGLNPPPPPDAAPDPAGSAKITPSGIQNFFGKAQVLFKVSGGGKSKEQSYILAENERQDGIEVKSIDQKNGIVTFDNHGVTQDIALVAPASSGAASPMPLNGPNGFTQPGNDNGNGNNFNGRGFSRFGQRGGGNRGNNNGNNMNGGGTDANGGDNLNLRQVPTRTYQPVAPQMTPEEIIIQTEKNHAAALDSGDPSAPLYPPTPLSGQY
jgi:hypothetical protein